MKIATIKVLLLTLMVGFVTVLPVLGAVPPVAYDDWQSGDAAFECAQIGSYTHAYKVNAAAPNGSWNHDGNTITISNSNGTVFDWSATQPIGAVIVKAAQGANVYFYDPQVTGDTGLAGYGGREVSHVTFCWNDAPRPHVTVSKSAEGIHNKTWNWTILKSATTNMSPTLVPGDDFDIYYTVAVTASLAESYSVSGTITVLNDGTVPAEVTGVSDTITGYGPADSLLCPSFPQSLNPGESFQCTYSSSLPNADQRTNEATATLTDGDVTPASVPFTVSVSETDECVNVVDSLQGSLGQVCATYDGEQFSFPYTVRVMDVTCGEGNRYNVATFTTNDTGGTGSDDETVTWYVNCEWCSPGYWRQEHHLDSWIATGISPDAHYTDYYAVTTLKRGAPQNPTLWEVLQSPQVYGGEAFNLVGDLLSGAHPDVDYYGERIENCPLN